MGAEMTFNIDRQVYPGSNWWAFDFHNRTPASSPTSTIKSSKSKKAAPGQGALFEEENA